MPLPKLVSALLPLRQLVVAVSKRRSAHRSPTAKLGRRLFPHAGRVGADDGREVDHPPTDPLPERARVQPRPGTCGLSGVPRSWWRPHDLDVPGMRSDGVYGPPLNTHCTTLDGPATVRISNLK